MRKLPGQRANDQHQRPAAEHLHAGGEKSPFGQVGITRKKGAYRPGQRAQYQHDCANRPHVTAAADVARPNEHDNADEADNESNKYCCGRTTAWRPHPLDDHEPEWKNRDEQGGETRWNELLSPYDGTVAAEKQQAAGDGRVTPLKTRGTRRAAITRPCIQENTRNDEAHSAHDEWRNGLHCVPDREIGRAPDQIDRSEGSQNPGARSAGVPFSQMIVRPAGVSCSNGGASPRALPPLPLWSAWLLCVFWERSGISQSARRVGARRARGFCSDCACRWQRRECCHRW